MKKAGFTLSEVLLSLAIVGILGAITIPQMVTSVEKHKTGALIGRAVEQITLGCQNYVQYYNDSVIDGRYIEKYTEIKDFDETILNKFIGLVEPYVSDADKEKYEGADFDGWLMLSKTPVYLKQEGAKGNITYLIDVNGFAGKNESDYDQYYLKLQDNCHIKPEGNAEQIFRDSFKVRIE